MVVTGSAVTFFFSDEVPGIMLREVAIHHQTDSWPGRRMEGRMEKGGVVGGVGVRWQRGASLTQINTPPPWIPLRGNRGDMPRSRVTPGNPGTL